MNKKGNLFVITAPSGTGKGTIISKLLENDKNICLSVSATTRAPREGEVNGVNYHFLTKEQFEQKIEQNALLEYAIYADNYYGTPLEYIDKNLQDGRDVILEIEVRGAENVRIKRPDATQIFISPPSFSELERRLVNRGTETREIIKKRLEIAKQEMEHKNEFDYIVVNDVLDVCCNEILDIIKKKR